LTFSFNNHRVVLGRSKDKKTAIREIHGPEHLLGKETTVM
jgi:hypothetical protein